MSEFMIQTHNFEKSKNQLKVFSEQTSKDIKLCKVDVKGGFLGLGSHKVTGEELNSLTIQIQNHLIDFNKLHTKLIKEFDQVYNAFESLDKDYIQAILIAIKAAEKANNDVKDAQEDIIETIKIQKKTIEALSQFKKKIDGYKYLPNIDKIWFDYQELQKEMDIVLKNIDSTKITLNKNAMVLDELLGFKMQINKIKHLKNVDRLWDDHENLKKYMFLEVKKVNSLTEKLESQAKSLVAFISFKERIDTISHINDVDILWNDVQNTHKEIVIIRNDFQGIQEKVNEQQQAIQLLCDFRYELEKYTHLKDIDVLWDKIEKNISRVSEHGKRINKAFDLISNNAQSIASIVRFKDKVENYEHLDDIDEIWNDAQNIHKEIETIGNDILGIQEKVNEQQQAIQLLCDFRYELEKYTHLKDIDVLWDKIEKNISRVSEHSKRINKAFDLISNNAQSIISIVQFKDKIEGYKHLDDIDEIWNQGNSLSLSITSTNEVVNDQQKQIAILENALKKLQQKNEESDQAISKKIKIVYALASSSIGIAIIELVLLVMRLF